MRSQNLNISLESEIDAFLYVKKEGIRENLDDTNTNATGATSKSIIIESDKFSGELLASENLENTETGTKPNEIVDFNDLKTWVEIKISPASQFVNAITGRIKENIESLGSNLWQEGGRKTIYTNELNNTNDEQELLNSISEKIATFTLDLFNGI